MILTVTPNPSIDATIELTSLERGEVNRAVAAHRQAGGKGINVANAAMLAGYAACAVAPAAPSDPFAALLETSPLQCAFVPIDATVRTNTTLTEADGTTTKINEHGPVLSAEEQHALREELTKRGAGADAVVLAGSLPPGVADNWYLELIEAARVAGAPLVALDTSDKPLQALGAALAEEHGEPGFAPDVIKPNAFELAQLTGTDGHELEALAKKGDFSLTVASARKLVDRGIAEVLVTLGGSGACLVTAEGAWAATTPPITVRSTVGAGDSSLAGYVTARVDGLASSECLRRAVAYGSAAASLPGTTLPTPEQLDAERTAVFPV